MKYRDFIALSAAAVLATLASGCTPPEPPQSPTGPIAPVQGTENVAPALAHYRDDVVVGDLWEREGLSARDRSLVTVAEMIAGNQSVELSFYVNKALDDGVLPREISETITHLAFYSGWQNAMAAVPKIGAAFKERSIEASALPAADPELLPLDEAAEQARAQQVESNFGSVSPGVVENTGKVLFQDLWLRPDLAPRDRSLITVVALVTSGQVQQIPFHLNRAMDNGLTRAEVAETLNQLAFYAGWPKVFTAMPVVKEVLGARQ
ncbi:carboxymuconolactone decarboxylase family protein [Arthrobacter globiformis]|uniref:carboxymuconolactone decarboxylase family protein n=1 Tax=Arthrobacter globiformis TaxID=1665 RepID=UPI00278F7005|nr:carboxymuconolactone decarboxylase family protein [Arthrobacter globiformis]MDQ0618641.1 4-carboxymuconolactone decarboxylase [Arthrobacter globiformis]